MGSSRRGTVAERAAAAGLADRPANSDATVALAQQIERTMIAASAGVAPVEVARDANDLEAGLVLVCDAITSLEDLLDLFRERRTEYFVALSRPDPETGRPLRSQPAIGQIAGVSDVTVNKALRAARAV